MNRCWRSPGLGWAVTLASCAAGCTSPGSWDSQIAYQGPAKLGGCVIADLDPSRSGSEVYVVGSDGSVLQIHRDRAGSWHHEVIATLPGEMVQCAAGEVGPEGARGLCVVGAREGEEADDRPGAAWWIELRDDTKGGRAWELTSVLEEDALLHAVCIGDLRPDLPGNEILVAGFDRCASVLTPRQGSAAPEDADLPRFTVVDQCPLQEPAKGAVCGRPGSAWIAGAQGGLHQLHFSSVGDAESRIARQFDHPLARIDEVEGQLLVCDNGGWLHHFDADVWQDHELSADRLRGAVLADVLPNSPGLELLTAGYDGSVYCLQEHRGERGQVGVQIEVIAQDTDRFHHVTCGRLDPWTVAIVGCGYSGAVTVVTRR